MYILINNVIRIIFCHLIGDYVLQTDYLAKTKGQNLYHLIAHCFLYIVPFYFVLGCDWRIGVLLITHFVVDALKARYKKIGYVTDQIIHYAVALVYLLE